VPTETVYFGSRTHLTEKTFKAIALEMPFVLVAPAHSLKYLREYGFRTFAPYIDESYDTITDDIKRIERVTHILLEIQARSAAAKNALWQQLLPIVEYNRNHFYRGGFRDRLRNRINNHVKGPMFRFVVDRIAKDQPYPNLARHTAEPYRQSGVSLDNMHRILYPQN
jgi:hypothetical protein